MCLHTVQCRRRFRKAEVESHKEGKSSSLGHPFFLGSCARGGGLGSGLYPGGRRPFFYFYAII